jgi:hypothetical protein
MEKPVIVNRPEAREAEEHVCPRCEGGGQVARRMTEPCPLCKGSGYTNGDHGETKPEQDARRSGIILERVVLCIDRGMVAQDEGAELLVDGSREPCALVGRPLTEGLVAGKRYRITVEGVADGS